MKYSVQDIILKRKNIYRQFDKFQKDWITNYLLSFIISIIIGWIKKEWQEQKRFMQMFNKFSGYDRLKE